MKNHNQENMFSNFDKKLEIKKVKNENGATVYHIEDEGCIQEFWTYREAAEYMRYIDPKSLISRPDWDQLEELFGEYN